MRILLIHQYFLEKNDGGGSRFNEMARIWSENEHEVSVLGGMVHYNTGKKPEKYEGKFTYSEDYAPGVHVVRCHVSQAYNVNFLGRLWGYFSFVFSSLYAGLFKVRGKHDIIVVTSPPLFVGITAYLLSRIKRIPFVFEVRDLWPESAIDTGVLTNKLLIRLAYRFERFIYRKAALINVLTPAFRDKLIEDKQVPAEKVIFIPNAADFSLADELHVNFNPSKFRAEHGLNGKKIVTYVGAHGVANHLIQVLDTAELLRDRKDIQFMLIGDGMQKKALMEEAEKRGLSNVIFHDPVPKQEVFKYIMASDFGASVLKKVDTFKTIYSNKTFDYMACKKPVICVIDGVSRQLINDAQCGVYVEPENPREFAEKLTQYCDKSDTELQEMGLAGYQYAKQHFDRAVLADKYIAHLQEILK